MMCNVESKLKYLHLFPDTLWNMAMVVRGIKSIYSKTTQQYGPRGGYHGTRTTTDLKPVAIFLSYVPANLKKEQLFVELFNTGMKMGDIDELTPDKLKDKAYYLKIEEKDFEHVTERFYDNDILLTDIKSGKYRSLSTRPILTIATTLRRWRRKRYTTKSEKKRLA